MAGAGLYEVGSGKPYSTISAALAQLWIDQSSAAFAATQEIRVYEGTYNEYVNPNPGLAPTATYRLLLQAAPGTLPVVDEQLSISSNAIELGQYPVRGPHFTTIRGFKVTNCLYNGIAIDADDLLIYDNIASDCNHGIMLDVGNRVKVYSNYCFDCTSQGWQGGDDFETAGIFIRGTDSTVYDNLTRACECGLDLENCSKARIYNNTSYLDASNGIRIYTANNTCKNNVVWSNVGTCLRVETAGQTGFTSDYNDLYPTGTANVGYWTSARATLGDWTTASGQDTHSISSDPKFNYAGGVNDYDYKIQSNSPCLKVGLNLSSEFLLDYWGVTRDSSAPWDMGFYEFVGSGFFSFF